MKEKPTKKEILKAFDRAHSPETHSMHVEGEKTKIDYHEIVEDIHDRVWFRSQVTGSTDVMNILARFLEDLEGDIIDHHRDLVDDPNSTWWTSI